MSTQDIRVGGLRLHHVGRDVEGGYLNLNGEPFYRIRHYDRMDPFFMSLVSDSNHWMFVSSNGALTCGRRNPASALFPYYAEDRIHDAHDRTGPKTVLLVEQPQGRALWEPFSERYAGTYEIERSIYKNIPGNKLMFEEVNRTLNLSFSYAWMTSDRFGFVRRASLSNRGEETVCCRLIDGLQNLLPANVDPFMQNTYSILIDAYKKSELLTGSGIGIFALSSVPVDRAEPSESLTANTVWSTGIEHAQRLLSVRQLDAFRRGEAVEEETAAHGMRCAYLLEAELRLSAGETKQWYMVAEVDQDACAIAALEKARPSETELLADIGLGSQNLMAIAGAADGIQSGGDPLQTARHFANTLFNVMRGGIFDDGYTVSKADLLEYIASADRPLARKLNLDHLPESFRYPDGLVQIRNTGDPEIERLYLEYLPLTFSRRHGDPSRPWNMFSIETRNPDGTRKLYYQGNWRDIFQNWEALGISYPGFFESMICRFVNASTADGYNPYRITRDGIDWEVDDPLDPWSYIGYWGDHQIIYLLKLLEHAESFYPGVLKTLLHREIFVYANVPYRIRPYQALLRDPHHSIDFDRDVHEAILALSRTIGSDGKLVHLHDKAIYRVNLTEKLLVPLLAKLTNFIPEAGIWMNTQRPEWNDANNALVGKGVSMVTLYYMRRCVDFYHSLFSRSEGGFAVSVEVAVLLRSLSAALFTHRPTLRTGFDDRRRRELLDLLGGAGERYRDALYRYGFSGCKYTLSSKEITDFLSLLLEFLDQSIDSNKRADGLYHAYNLMRVEPDGGISIRHLYEMLEGQVAVLTSGILDATQSLEVLRALRRSALYREDQHSYILYPDRRLPDFMEKNRVPEMEKPDPRIVSRDCNGVLHFNPAFRNAALLAEALDEAGCSAEERDAWLARYEEVFDHQSFTGRSGTFYKYEGLGSIYWHMVSKLLLTVQEICIRARGTEAEAPLKACYYDIRKGIGAHKSVLEQGAFPTDPYSHTPSMTGAQQPGLTGQVKEDFMIRLFELGVRVKDGCLGFDAFLSNESDVTFTVCTVPVEIRTAATNRVHVVRSDGTSLEFDGLFLDRSVSAEIFGRTGAVERIRVEQHD